MKKVRLINLVAFLLCLFLGLNSLYGQFYLGLDLNYFHTSSSQRGKGYKSPMFGIQGGVLMEDRLCLSTSIRIGTYKVADVYPIGYTTYRINTYSLRLAYWAKLERLVLYPLFELNLVAWKEKDFRDVERNLLVTLGGGFYYPINPNLKIGLEIVGTNTKNPNIKENYHDKQASPVIRIGTGLIYIFNKKDQ